MELAMASRSSDVSDGPVCQGIGRSWRRLRSK